ncbi:MAG TPA: substrate-binding domain-containing protein [Terracidiphilus sp.]|nr:substrate-binding domain-containing protein [Terracidiphilus sp.]
MKPGRHIAMLMAGLVLACSTSCNTNKNKEVYYLIAANVQLPYWQSVANGFNKAAATYKAQAKVVGPQTYDPLAELDALQQAIRAQPSGILISVSDVSTLEREIDTAVRQGIPVITVDSDAAASHRLYFIGTNNVEAGRLGGVRLIEKLGNKGNVAFFTIPGQPNLEDRLSGFRQILSSSPGIKPEIVDMKGNPSTAFDEAQRLLSRTGGEKVDAIVCLEAISGKPVADAMKRAKASGRVVISWDTDQGTLDAIRDGTIDSTIAQKPYTMGFFGLKLLHDVFDAPPSQLYKVFRTDFFSPYPVFVDTGSALIDKSNVDLYFSAEAANQ